jgi:hypothetical protein
MLNARKNVDASNSPRRSRTFPKIFAWFAVDDIHPDPDVSHLNRAPSFSEEQLHTPPLDPPNPDHLIHVDRHGKLFYFQQDQLQDIAEQYRSGQKESAQICTEITDLAGRSLNPVKRTVTRYWTDHGF